MEWADQNPYFVLIVAMERKADGSQEHLILDVGEKGWAAKYADWLRRPAEWYLCEKVGAQKVIAAQLVYEGDQPYYLKRHVGQIQIGTNRHRSIEVHGIGKRVPATYLPRKRKNAKQVLVTPERTDRIWIMPHGVVCGGEDVEKLALAVVATMEWQESQPEPEKQPEAASTE